MQRLCLLLVGILVFVSLCVGAILAQSEPPAISILSCVAGAGATERPGITVGFRNDSSVELTSIVWRARFGRGWLDFTDSGDFAPGATVTQTLYWRAGLAGGYYRNGAENCAVVATQAKNGEHWQRAGAVLDPDYSFPTPPA
jgi:hypothetical protein